MNPTTSSAPRNRRARVMTAIFALVILIPSMLGFVAKFIEFIASSTANAVHHNVHSNSNET